MTDWCEQHGTQVLEPLQFGFELVRRTRQVEVDASRAHRTPLQSDTAYARVVVQTDPSTFVLPLTDLQAEQQLPERG